MNLGVNANCGPELMAGDMVGILAIVGVVWCGEDLC
jgi:hypothetical protein